MISFTGPFKKRGFDGTSFNRSPTFSSLRNKGFFVFFSNGKVQVGKKMRTGDLLLKIMTPLLIFFLVSRQITLDEPKTKSLSTNLLALERQAHKVKCCKVGFKSVQ